MPGKGYAPLHPYPFQQDFINCRDDYRAINKPRQCGISTIVAAEVAWEFDNVPGAQIMIVSKDLAAAQNFHIYVMDILRSVRENNPDAPKLTKTNQSETRNENGSRIVSLAAGKEAGRSFSPTHFVFDEAAFTQYDDDIWQAASSGLAKTMGRATVISTPKGRANWFYRLFEEPGNMGFTIFNYAWWDVPDYNPLYGEMMAAASANEKNQIIEQAKFGVWYKKIRPSKTDLQWRQEFEGAFDANVGSVFSTRSLERAFRRNYLQEKIDPTGLITEWWSSEKQEKRLYYTGIDLGRKNDPTILLTYDATDYDPSERDEDGRFLSPAKVIDFKYIEAGTLEWSELEKICLAHLKFWKGASEHDGTGSGDSFSEAVYGYSDPFMFTKQSKQDMIGTIQHAFDYGAVILPKIALLYREHQKYIWDDKDLVQDTVMANGLAIKQFHDGGANIFLGFKRVEFMGELQAA